MTTEIEALEKAINLMIKPGRKTGGQTNLAKAIGITQGHLWSWLNRDGKVPAQYAIPIERATNGQVTRFELRPDIYPPEDGKKNGGNPPPAEHQAGVATSQSAA